MKEKWVGHQVLPQPPSGPPANRLRRPGRISFPKKRHLALAALPVVVLAQCAPSCTPPAPPPAPANADIMEVAPSHPTGNCTSVQRDGKGYLQVVAGGDADVLHVHADLHTGGATFPLDDEINVEGGEGYYFPYSLISEFARNMGWRGNGSLDVVVFLENNTDGRDPRSYSLEYDHCIGFWGN